MKTSSRYLRLVWLGAETVLSALGLYLLTRTLLTQENLPQEQLTATIACMVLLGIVFASACYHARGQKQTTS